MAVDSPSPSPPKAPTQLGAAHVAIVALVMGALVWIVFLALDNADDSGDAAAVLGTVVPGIAAIGAAVFGIPLAYQTGKAGGVADGKKQVATRLLQGSASEPSALAAMGAQESDSVGRIRAELLDILAST